MTKKKITEAEIGKRQKELIAVTRLLVSMVENLNQQANEISKAFATFKTIADSPAFKNYEIYLNERLRLSRERLKE